MNRHISYLYTLNLAGYAYYYSPVNIIIFPDKITIILSGVHCSYFKQCAFHLLDFLLLFHCKWSQLVTKLLLWQIESILKDLVFNLSMCHFVFQLSCPLFEEGRAHCFAAVCWLVSPQKLSSQRLHILNWNLVYRFIIRKSFKFNFWYNRTIFDSYAPWT